MDGNYKLIGAPCAVRGPYVFYKAFKYTKNDVTNILTINEFFFVKLWSNSDLISIGELRLLWEDKNCDKTLASLRLYILPENTPDGRISDVHGEDEVLAITEKVVIRLEDLLTWITDASDWNWGLSAVWRKHCTLNNNTDVEHPKGEGKVNGIKDSEANDNKQRIFENERINTLVDCSAVDYSDVYKEKTMLDISNWESRTGVIVLSYSRYCRYRGLLKRLEGVHNEWLRNKLIKALGGFTVACRTTKILFCKDTFDYPDLEGHELLCNHLAPKLRSRIPKKKKSLYPSPDVSESESSSDYVTEDDSSCSSTPSIGQANRNISIQTGFRKVDTGKWVNNCSVSVTVNSSSSNDNNHRVQSQVKENMHRSFIQNLYAFMKARLTPIGKIPSIGNRTINLFEFYNKVKHLGGYVAVTENKLWKYVFEELGGDRNNPGASIVPRKHYERFLLPYEQHMSQQMRYASPNQQFMKHSDSGVITGYPANNLHDYRLQADRRRVQSAVQRSVNPSLFPGRPSGATGGKENIPISDKRKSIASVLSSEVVIDLCADDEGTSRTSSSSADVTEIIDLCEETSIRRSVPSIAATLVPRKRKLDILREGGLEVTPIATSSSDIVTITRKTMPSASGTSSGDGSDNAKSSQVLDLRMMKGSGSSNVSSESEDDVLRKFSPNLGPNIEISLVAIGSGDGNRRASEERRRKPTLPVPALRKISTGEIAMKSMAAPSRDQWGSPRVSMTPKNLTTTHVPQPMVSISSAMTTNTSSQGKGSAPPSAATQFVAVNQAFYLASLYNTIIPQQAAQALAAGFQSTNGDLQLSQEQLSYVKEAIKHQQQGIAMVESFSQKFSTMIKNNGAVPIVDNCEQILPD